MDSITILKLYANVLREDIVRHRIPDGRIRAGVVDMARAYAPEVNVLQNDFTARQYTDYNNAAFRCAYLHKYAPLHTYIVLDVMLRILKQELLLFKKLVSSGEFKFCCLGGGPGSDAVGVLMALQVAFENFKSSATIIDSMKQWEDTFSSIVRELRFGAYDIRWHTLHENFQWNYIGADLLCNMTNEINKAIGSASFITMVKFISAASCKVTEPMVEKIFRVMKPQALVLFIDNAAGGFTELVLRVGKKNGFRLKFNLRHTLYSNEELKIDRFGYTSCFETRVTVILLQKPDNFHQRTRPNATSDYMERPFQSAPYIVEASPERRAQALSSISSNARPAVVRTVQPKSIGQRGRKTRRNNANRSIQVPYSGIINAGRDDMSPVSSSPFDSDTSAFLRSQPDRYEENNGFEDGCCSCCVIS